MEILQKGDGFAQDPNEPAVAELIQRLGKIVTRRSGGSPIVLYMLIGRTDQAQYICHPSRKPVCLGFCPVYIPDNMKLFSLYHGVNERIPVDGFKWGLGVLIESVLELCGASLD